MLFSRQQFLQWLVLLAYLGLFQRLRIVKISQNDQWLGEAKSNRI